MADDDAPLGEQILNVAEAEVETKVQPDGVSDDLGREAVASTGRVVAGYERRTSGDAYRRFPLKLTTPTQMGESGAQWALIMSGTLLVVSPLLVLFLLFQRQFISSFIRSGLK